MQVVCEATQGNEPDIQVAALQNLVKIMSLYYVHMEAYMGPALFAVSGLDTEMMGGPMSCFVYYYYRYCRSTIFHCHLIFVGRGKNER